MFLEYAFGSAKEMEVTLNPSKDLGFIPGENYGVLYEDLQKFIAKLVLFSRHLQELVTPTKEVLTNRMLRSDLPITKEF